MDRWGYHGGRSTRSSSAKWLEDMDTNLAVYAGPAGGVGVHTLLEGMHI